MVAGIVIVITVVGVITGIGMCARSNGQHTAPRSDPAVEGVRGMLRRM
jgi:hypothetical protein